MQSSMNWQEKRIRQRQLSRFWAGFSILTLFTLIAIFGLLQKISWKNVGDFLSEVNLNFVLPSSELLMPIPQDEPFLEITNLLLAKHIEIESRPIYSGSTIIVRLLDGTSVNFSLEKDLSKQASSLQIILSRLTIEGKKVGKIDFRYEPPVMQ